MINRGLGHIFLTRVHHVAQTDKCETGLNQFMEAIKKIDDIISQSTKIWACNAVLQKKLQSNYTNL